VVAWIAGLVLLLLLGKILSHLTLRSIERNADFSGAAVSSKELAIRRVYKMLINVAGMYYYVSLPFVIVLLIAVAGSVFYAFMALGRIPIRLMAILVVGTIVTIYKMIQSLFIKIKTDDPGRPISPEEAPALWKLT